MAAETPPDWLPWTYRNTIARLGDIGPSLIAAKLSPYGQFLWVDTGGGSSGDYGRGATYDGAGHLAVSGYFANSGIFRTTSLTSSGSNDLVVWKIAPP